MAKSDIARNKNPHEGHRERMRERFSTGGFDNYRPHEVLEQILFHALPRVNTNETAHHLLNEFGDLMAVLRAEREDLLKIHGIGEKSADYIRSIIPRVSDMIVRQYRELSELNIYNIAFLGDWFLRYENNSKIGVVQCTGDRRFVDFILIEPILDDGELDPYKIGDIIAKRLSIERYYVIVKQENMHITRENMLVLRDYTSRLGTFMTDAYAMCGSAPVSYLYK